MTEKEDIVRYNDNKVLKKIDRKTLVSNDKNNKRKSRRGRQKMDDRTSKERNKEKESIE